MVKIAHLTSAHPRYDTRIFYKMCKSLSKKYEVNLVVADGKGDEIKDNINIFDVGKSKNRKDRMLNTTKKVFQKALKINAKIYHVHDPELIPIGVKLKKLGFKVIFDMHENTPKQIKNKNYIPFILRNIISNIYKFYERRYISKFDFVIFAEDSYVLDYKYLKNTTVILNMPDIKKLDKFYKTERKENGIFYVGRINNNRGLDITLKALQILKEKNIDFYMYYIGFYNKDELNYLDKNINKNIKFYGPLPLFDAMEYSLKSKVGLSVLKPIDNYLHSYSTKIFEYMAIGLPIITSNFPLYTNIVEKNECGICINPINVQELANAIEYIFKHPKKAKIMGENGRKLIEKKYNWDIEEKKLFTVYERILND